VTGEAGEEGMSMATVPLTVYVDAEAAKAYYSASEQDRRAMQYLLGLRLREIVAAPRVSLREAMDAMGREAEARGLTPEILEAILQEE
jgi:hypothetical protein